LFTKKLKRFIAKVFSGIPFPVFNNQLKGMRLPISPLMSGRLYFDDVEPQVHNVYDLFLKPGCVFFDVGANVGLHSYYVSRKFKNSQVYAFEPLPSNAAYIRSSIKLNRISNITLYEEAIADKKGIAFFDQSINNHQGRISSQESAMQVKLTSLDDFINETGIKPDLLKIDVEGTEDMVMEGFRENITKVQPVMIIEVHTKQQSDKMLAYFRPLNYKLLRIVPLVKGSGKYFHKIYLDAADENVTGQLVALPAFMYSNYQQYLY
jgi:FkbM family methyltransferase